MSGICVRRTLHCVQGTSLVAKAGVLHPDGLLRTLQMLVGVLMAHPVPQRWVMAVLLGLPAFWLRLRLPKRVGTRSKNVLSQRCGTGIRRRSRHGTAEPQAPAEARADRYSLLFGTGTPLVWLADCCDGTLFIGARVLFRWRKCMACWVQEDDHFGDMYVCPALVEPLDSRSHESESNLLRCWVSDLQ
jgi:hypothetical protein